MAMTSNPWTKFFWNDWENDPALRLCSLAGQGLWMRCLCIAAKADPFGYVLVGRRPVTATDLARLTGVSESEVESLLTELDRNGVFSRDRKGRIYSRRMVRDARRSAEGRKHGKNGGNPALSQDAENPRENGGPLRVGLRGADNPHKPRAKSQEPEREEGGGKPPPDLAFVGKVIRLNSADFDRWRRAYPNIPDIVAELQAADDYYAENPPDGGKWFFPVSSWLKRANTDGQRQRKEAGRGVDFW